MVLIMFHSDKTLILRFFWSINSPYLCSKVPRLRSLCATGALQTGDPAWFEARWQRWNRLVQWNVYRKPGGNLIVKHTTRCGFHMDDFRRVFPESNNEQVSSKEMPAERRKMTLWSAIFSDHWPCCSTHDPGIVPPRCEMPEPEDM